MTAFGLTGKQAGESAEKDETRRGEADKVDRVATQLRQLEESMLAVTVRHNSDRMSELLADDFIEFGSSGRLWTRQAIIDSLAEEKDFSAPSIEDFQCKLLSEHIALVTYRAVRKCANAAEWLESLRSSIWTRNNGHWQIRFHQGTRTACCGQSERRET